LSFFILKGTEDRPMLFLIKSFTLDTLVQKHYTLATYATGKSFGLHLHMSFL